MPQGFVRCLALPVREPELRPPLLLHLFAHAQLLLVHVVRELEEAVVRDFPFRGTAQRGLSEVETPVSGKIHVELGFSALRPGLSPTADGPRRPPRSEVNNSE